MDEELEKLIEDIRQAAADDKKKLEETFRDSVIEEIEQNSKDLSRAVRQAEEKMKGVGEQLEKSSNTLSLLSGRVGEAAKTIELVVEQSEMVSNEAKNAECRLKGASEGLETAVREMGAAREETVSVKEELDQSYNVLILKLEDLNRLADATNSYLKQLQPVGALLQESVAVQKDLTGVYESNLTAIREQSCALSVQQEETERDRKRQQMILQVLMILAALNLIFNMVYVLF